MKPARTQVANTPKTNIDNYYCDL